MKEVQSISNVDNFLVVDDKLYFSNGKEVIDEKGHSILNSPLSLQFLNYKEPYFYIPDIYGNTYLIMEKETRFLKDIFIKKVISDSFLLVSKDKKTAILNIINNEFHYILNSRIFKFLEWKEKLFFKNKNTIQGIEIYTGQFLWEFPLSSLGKGKDYNTDEEFDYEVEQFVGIYNNILWVYIERGGFIGLDIQTGELKHRILGIPKGNLLGKVDSYVDSEEFYIFYRAKFILDDKKGIIIGLIADRFFEIDLNKEKATPMLYGMWDKMEKMNLKKYGVNGNTSLQGDLLYFYNDKELQFGILDINTKEIIYISEPIAVVERDDSFTRLRDLKVSENKVYILDSNHTLHIFEREKLNFELGKSCKLAPAGEAKSYYRN
ncbi:hypothetical protein [Capnocytophaga leadbetteri]|uniref:hypothetical protein n=1 Tax=Capnocytophaga leadbetteri TaxID=327575 RepID=UPI0028E21F9A|nr:hypothetical protein [Capnocytophaga leadbetteri]